MKTEIPADSFPEALTESTRHYLIAEVSHDHRCDGAAGLERVRWNSKAIWMCLRRINDDEVRIEALTKRVALLEDIIKEAPHDEDCAKFMPRTVLQGVTEPVECDCWISEVFMKPESADGKEGG